MVHMHLEKHCNLITRKIKYNYIWYKLLTDICYVYRLTKLDVSDNAMTDNGVKSLASSMKSNNMLVGKLTQLMCI